MRHNTFGTAGDDESLVLRDCAASHGALMAYENLEGEDTVAIDYRNPDSNRQLTTVLSQSLPTCVRYPLSIVQIFSDWSMLAVTISVP